MLITILPHYFTRYIAILLTAVLLLVLPGGCGQPQAEIAPPANTPVPVTAAPEEGGAADSEDDETAADTDEEQTPTSDEIDEVAEETPASDEGEAPNDAEVMPPAVGDAPEDSVKSELGSMIDNLPRYPGAEAVPDDELSSQEIEEAFTSQTGMQAAARYYTLPVDTTFEDVFNFYAEELSAAGWELWSAADANPDAPIGGWTRPDGGQIVIIQVLSADDIGVVGASSSVLSVILTGGTAQGTAEEEAPAVEDTPPTQDMTTTDEITATEGQDDAP